LPPPPSACHSTSTSTDSPRRDARPSLSALSAATDQRRYHSSERDTLVAGRGDDEESEFGQFIADERAESPYERAVEILTKEALRDALQNLSYRERRDAERSVSLYERLAASPGMAQALIDAGWRSMSHT
jgi:hypothetical protein